MCECDDRDYGTSSQDHRVWLRLFPDLARGHTSGESVRRRLIRCERTLRLYRPYTRGVSSASTLWAIRKREPVHGEKNLSVTCTNVQFFSYKTSIYH